jgi:hypothetical protein
MRKRNSPRQLHRFLKQATRVTEFAPTTEDNLRSRRLPKAVHVLPRAKLIRAIRTN